MSEDHLSSDTSISVTVTDNSLTASAKSRTVAAIDRLAGSIADSGAAWVEGFAVRRRAKTEGERQLIEAAAKYGIERMGADEEFAERAFGNHFRKLAQQQANKDAVAVEALDVLRKEPPTEAEAIEGPSQLSDEFMARFEAFAEAATTEQLRERWGRVLASEIRKPGTFNAKVMRITDELDAQTATLFEGLMRYRVRNLLLKGIMPEMQFADLASLVSAGLLIDVQSQRHTFARGESFGRPAFIFQFGNGAIAFSPPKQAETSFPEILSVGFDRVPNFGVYLLTEAGLSLSSILASHEYDAGLRFANRLNSLLPRGDVTFVLRDSAGHASVVPLPKASEL